MIRFPRISIEVTSQIKLRYPVTFKIIYEILFISWDFFKSKYMPRKRYLRDIPPYLKGEKLSMG